MAEIRRRRGDEGGRGGALRAVQSAERTDARRDSREDEGDEERERRDPAVGQLLQRVRCAAGRRFGRPSGSACARSRRCPRRRRRASGARTRPTPRPTSTAGCWDRGSSNRLGSFTTSLQSRPEVTASAAATEPATAAARRATTAVKISHRLARRRCSSDRDRRSPIASTATTTSAPTTVSTPKTFPSATRSARRATSCVSAGRVKAQAPTAAAGKADARSSSPLCTRSLDRASQSTSTPTATTRPARDSASMRASVAT